MSRPPAIPLAARRRPKAAFTLIEVLLALALLAGLLAALNQFVFSLAESAVRDRDRFIFAQHTRGVARHLDELFRTAATAAQASGATRDGQGGAPGAARVRTPDSVEQVLVAFVLPEGDRLLSWPEAPLPDVRCALAWQRDEGLVLYYQSRLEEDYAESRPRVAPLSRFVTGLSYDYYDPDRRTWESRDTLKEENDQPVTPRRVQLRFERGSQVLTETITLPLIRAGLPAP